MSNHPPEVTVELTRELAEFVVENCDSNLVLGLQLTQSLQDRDKLEQLVALNDRFKKLKDAVKKGLAT